MSKFKVVVLVDAPDVMMAVLYQVGIQNVLNELGENQKVLADLSDASLASKYKSMLFKMLDNPLVKKLAGSFGG